jgi:hypothetical protein
MQKAFIHLDPKMNTRLSEIRKSLGVLDLNLGNVKKEIELSPYSNDLCSLCLTRFWDLNSEKLNFVKMECGHISCKNCVATKVTRKCAACKRQDGRRS